jgi:phosphoenolpyruvate-protein kinase (PTS system EI component)
VRAAEVHDRPVGVCGELAGDPPSALLLAGLGVSELSMAPALVADVKAALREVDFPRLREVAAEALRAPDAASARALAAALL